MSEGMNRAHLIGNLGADAELRHFATGARLTFNLATTERWKDKNTGEPKDRTEWHRCVLWGPRAEKLAPHLTKGTTLFVEGSIETRSYDKDGQKKYSTDIRVRDLRFVGTKRRPGDGVDLADVLSGAASPSTFAPGGAAHP